MKFKIWDGGEYEKQCSRIMYSTGVTFGRAREVGALDGRGSWDQMSCGHVKYHEGTRKSEVGVVPNYVVGESEMEASKEGRSLSDFKYACLGYSAYMENKNSPTDEQEGQAELPFCVGVEERIEFGTRRTENCLL
eukprot:Gb_13019 [translate_table: standard]